MSLIEVLVALLITSIGALAISGLQLVVQRNTQESFQRSRAAQLAFDLVERMRANSTPAALESYVASTSPWPERWAGRGNLLSADDGADCANARACTGKELAHADLLAWEREMDGATEQAGGQWLGGLLMPTACIAGPPDGSSGVYTVTVTWRGSIALISSGSAACGSDAVASGEHIYGEADKYRRRIVLQAYIVARS